MKIAIHQPNYIPWLGFFSKLKAVDTFILLDDVEYTKNSFINRNLIKTTQGPTLLTIPIKYKNNSSTPIKDIEIADTKQIKKHWKTIEQSYKKTAFWAQYADTFANIYETPYSLISELNLALITTIAAGFNIQTTLAKSSDTPVLSQKSERIIELVKAHNGTEYLSGHGAKSYNDPNLFENANIKLSYASFQEPVYTQLWGDFIPKLSALDALFNHGPSFSSNL